MVSLKRPSKLVLVLNILLCTFALTTTIYALNSYLWWAAQHGKQEVGYAVLGSAINFTLPKGYVDYSSYSYASPTETAPSDPLLSPPVDPILSVQTWKPNLVLQINCLNPNALSLNYTALTLLVAQRGTSSIWQLDLCTNNDGSGLNITMTSIGIYSFNYRVEYTPSQPSSQNDISLFVNVVKA